MNVVTRQWIASLLWAIFIVSLIGLFVIFAGSNKQYRQENEGLKAQLARISFVSSAVPSLGELPEAAFDPYVIASEVISLHELQPQEGDSEFRYFVIEVPQEGGGTKRFVFKARTSLVVDCLKDAVKCVMPW